VRSEQASARVARAIHRMSELRRETSVYTSYYNPRVANGSEFGWDVVNTKHVAVLKPTALEYDNRKLHDREFAAVVEDGQAQVLTGEKLG